MESLSSTSLRTDVKLQLDLKQIYFREHGKYFLQFSLISDKPHLIEKVERSCGQKSNVFSEVAHLESSTDRSLLFSQTIDFTTRKTSMNFRNSFTYKFPKGVDMRKLKNNTYLKAEAILFEKDRKVLKNSRKVAEVMINLEYIDKTLGKIRETEFKSKNKKSTLGLMLYTACLNQQTFIKNQQPKSLQSEYSLIEVVPSMSESNLGSIEEQIASESSRDAWHGIRDERRRQRNQAILMEKGGPQHHIECEAGNRRGKSNDNAVEIFECKVRMSDENEEQQTMMEDEEKEDEVIGDDGERVTEKKCKARKNQSAATTQKQQEEILQKYEGAIPCEKVKTDKCNDGDSEQQNEENESEQSNNDDGDGGESRPSSTQVFITEVPNNGSAAAVATDNMSNDGELMPAPVELRPSHSRLNLQQDLRDAGNLLEEGMASDSSLGEDEAGGIGLQLRSSRSQVNLTLGDTAADRQHQDRLRTIAEQERQRNGRRTSAADAYWNRIEVHFDAADQEVTTSSVENLNHRLNQAHLSDEGVDLNCSVYSTSDTNHSAGGHGAPHSSAGAPQHGSGENHEETQTDKVLTFPLVHESNTTNVARLFLTHFHESQADDGAALHESCLACQLRRLKFLNIFTCNSKPMGTLQLFGEIEHGNENLVIARYQLLSTADTACGNDHACGEQVALLKTVSSKKSQTPRSFMKRYNSRQDGATNIRNLSTSSLRLPITTSSPLKTRTVTFPQIEKLKKHGGEKRKCRPPLLAVTEKRRNCGDNRSIIRRNIQQVSARCDAKKTQQTPFKPLTQVGKRDTAKKTARPSTSAQSVESARAQVRRGMQDYRRLLDDLKNGKRFNTAAAEARKKAVSESIAQRIGSKTKVEPKTRAKKLTEQNTTGYHGQRLKKINKSGVGVKTVRKTTTARTNAGAHLRSSCRASNLEIGTPTVSQNKHRTFGPPPSRPFKKAPTKFRKSFDRPRETRSSLDTGLFSRSKLPPKTRSLPNKTLNRLSGSSTTTSAVKRSCTATELRCSRFSARKDVNKSISRLVVQDFHRTKLMEKVKAAKTSEQAPAIRKNSSQWKDNNFTPVLPSIQEDS